MSICCIIGHNDVYFAPQMQDKLYETLEHLVNLGVDAFYIERANMFTQLCFANVALLQKQYPHIQRIYLDFEHNREDEDMKKYLLTQYDSLDSPQSLKFQKKISKKRTNLLVDISCACLFYWNEEFWKIRKRSNAKASIVSNEVFSAYKYATNRNKLVINCAKWNIDSI